MARYALGFLTAPILLGACVVAATQVTRDGAQRMRDAADVRDRRAPPVSSERAAPRPVPVPAHLPRAGPVHAVEDKLEPGAPAPSFTRVLERAQIEARGAARLNARVDARIAAAAFRAMVPVDNRAWPVDQRRALLAFLRGRAVDGDAQFTEADVRIIAHLQAGSGARSDGVISDETMAILLAMGFRASARKAMPSEVKLEFYPGELEDLVAWNRELETTVTKNGGKYDDVTEPAGEGTIYVRVGGSLVASYRGRGGPPSVVDNGKHVAVPTTPGTYTLGEEHAHVTSNWYYSQIPWGAEIRAQEGGYQYRWAGRASWAWATNHPAGTLKEPMAADDFENLPEVTREGITYFLWNKNDFGPVAWNLVPGDQYVHTTPKAEAAMADAADAGPNLMTSLTASHGCIHLDPRERDEMVARGYLAKDILFVVRRWDEHVLPDEIRRGMIDPTTVGLLRESTPE